MKLNENFIYHRLDDETLIVPLGSASFRGLVQGNKTLAAIAECLAHDTTEEEIVDTLCARYDGDREVIAEDVADAIRRLKAIGAINE